MVIYDLEKSLEDTLEDNKKEILKSEYPDDLISEYVDGAIPVYTSTLLDIAQSELWLAVDAPEIYGFDGSTSPINGIVGNIYGHLSELAYKWLEKQQKTKD